MTTPKNSIWCRHPRTDTECSGQEPNRNLLSVAWSPPAGLRGVPAVRTLRRFSPSPVESVDDDHYRRRKAIKQATRGTRWGHIEFSRPAINVRDVFAACCLLMLLLPLLSRLFRSTCGGVEHRLPRPHASRTINWVYIHTTHFSERASEQSLMCSAAPGRTRRRRCLGNDAALRLVGSQPNSLLRRDSFRSLTR